MADGATGEIVTLPADAAFVAAWDKLAAAAGTANPFYAPAAVTACLNLPEAPPPRLFALRNAGRDALLGVLPVATRRVRGLPLSVENWDQRVRALGEPLILPGCERAFWEAALARLSAMPGQYLRLSALDADSPSTRALLALLAARGRAHHVTRSYGRAMLHGGLSSEAHAAQHVRGKVLKEHRRLRARLADRGALCFERLAADAPADPWIDRLFALEATGWKGREGVAASADPVTEHAFRAILREAHARGALDFRRMTVGGDAIAMLASLERDDEAFQLKIAYDESWAAFSPGVLLEMNYLAYALDERGLARVDSCARAGHPMIDRIWPDRRRIVSLAVPFDTVASRLLCLAQDRWRARRAQTPNPTLAGAEA